MRIAILAALALLGCRAYEAKTDDSGGGVDTAALAGTPAYDMAIAWCNFIECREGFYGDDETEGFYNVGDCIETYGVYWTSEEEPGPGAAECFTDDDAVNACTAALEALTCPDDTPAECEAILQCSADAD